MDYSLIIRRAKPDCDDVKAIKTVMNDAFQKYIQDAGLTVTLDALGETETDILKAINEQHVYIAFVDNLPVGSIRVNINYDNNTAYISRFGVCKGYQNIGIGKSFMNLVDKLLVSKRVKQAMLHTASKYTALVRFYYGCGFYIESTSCERGYIRALFIKNYD